MEINSQNPVLESSYAQAPINDVQIKTGGNRKISNTQIFALDINSSAWATGDVTSRIVNLIWFNWDRAKSYSQEIITSLWSTTATVTKQYTIDTPKNNIIRVPSWKIIEVSARFSSATQTLVINNTTWSFRYVWGTSNSLTSANPSVAMFNVGTDDLNINLKFSTSASDRPNFGILIKITW